MNYFFPNPFIAGEKYPLTADIKLHTTIDSGKSAIQVVLKSFDLGKGAKVGIPAFCCSSLQRALTDEGFVPFFFDFIGSGTYWADYSEEQLLKSNVKAIILTHLYGFIHPETKQIMDFCKGHNIKVIHDVAQSYGIDISEFGTDPVVYSFGPGKSSTAALGGEIIWLNELRQYQRPSLKRRLHARLFFKARSIGSSNKRITGILLKYFGKGLDQPNAFYDMSYFQKNKAVEAKYITDHKTQDRKVRYDLLKNAIANNTQLSVAPGNEIGLCFKIVIYVKEDVEGFIKYLSQNQVPFYRLSNDINSKDRKKEQLPFFYKSYECFVEISTERSIPLEEISRIANKLEKYIK